MTSADLRPRYDTGRDGKGVVWKGEEEGSREKRGKETLTGETYQWLCLRLP